MNRQEVKLDFVGVGAAKAGTSWLATCLGEHPGLCMADPKELNYFCEKAIWPKFGVNMGLGPEWLAERFAHRKPGQRLGEFSPNYLCDPHSPALIFRHNPDCRLIFSLRHPIDALVSFYHQVRKEAPVADTLEGFLDDYPEVYEIGNYHRHANAFLKVFPRQQCLFLLFEDIQQDPLAVLRKCFAFIGVDEDFIPRNSSQRINQPEEPRSRTLMATMDWTRKLMQDHGSSPRLQRLLWKLRVYRLHGWVMQRNLKPFVPSPVAENLRRRLLDRYGDDTRGLASLLDRDLSLWER